MTAPDFRENEICLQHFQIKADNKFYNVKPVSKESNNFFLKMKKEGHQAMVTGYH